MVLIVFERTQQVIYVLLLNEYVIAIEAMLGSYRLFIIVKLILFELLELGKNVLLFLF